MYQVAQEGGHPEPGQHEAGAGGGRRAHPGINLYEQGAGKMNLLNSTVGTLLVRSRRGLADACSLSNAWAALPLRCCWS